MRYFFADELAISLADADLQLIDLVPFPNRGRAINRDVERNGDRGRVTKGGPNRSAKLAAMIRHEAWR